METDFQERLLIWILLKCYFQKDYLISYLDTVVMLSKFQNDAKGYSKKMKEVAR